MNLSTTYHYLLVNICYVPGDMVKYFLYVYPSDSEEELNMSQETDPGNSSIECEAEGNKDGGWYKKAQDTVYR